MLSTLSCNPPLMFSGQMHRKIQLYASGMRAITQTIYPKADSTNCLCVQMRSSSVARRLSVRSAKHCSETIQVRKAVAAEPHETLEDHAAHNPHTKYIRLKIDDKLDQFAQKPAALRVNFQPYSPTTAHQAHHSLGEQS